MSQASPQSPERGVKNMAAAFYAVADGIDEAQRLPAILAAVGQIVSDATALLGASSPSRQPNAGAKAVKPATAAAEGAIQVEGATPAAAPAAKRVAKRRGRPAKMKRPMPRGAAAAAENGAAAAA